MIDQTYQKERQIKGYELSSRQLENVVITWNGVHSGGTRSKSEIKSEGRWWTVKSLKLVMWMIELSSSRRAVFDYKF